MKAYFNHWTSILLWISPFLAAMGLTIGFTSGNWGVLPVVLVILAIGLAIAALLGQAGGMKSFWGQRSTQVGTNALLSTVAVVAIFLLINFIATRYNVRFDLTENRLYTLAPQSQEVVKDLREPVKAWIFDFSPNAQDKQLLDNYQRQNQFFTYEYVDPQTQPGLAERFGVKNFGEVYLEKGDKRQSVQTVSQEQRLSERRLTNALVQISSDRQNKIYFLQGHGERVLQSGQNGLSQAAESLGQESFTAEPLNLADTGKIPEDATVVVVAGPQRALLKEEVAALREYQKKRSGLMLLIDPQTNPELGDLLKDWGIQFGDRVLVDPEGGQQGIVTIITQYGQHPITQELGNGISFYPLARPVEVAGEVKNVQTAPLLITNSRTEARIIGSDGKLSADPSSPPGSLVLGVALSRPVDAEPKPSPSPSPSPNADSETPPEARLVAIGNSSFIGDGLFTQQLNKDVFLNAVNWLSQQQNLTLAVRPAEQTNRRVLLSPSQQTWLALLAMAFLPLVGFFMAIGVWWKRR